MPEPIEPLDYAPPKKPKKVGPIFRTIFAVQGIVAVILAIILPFVMLRSHRWQFGLFALVSAGLAYICFLMTWRGYWL
jgi:hypothetical protein